MALIYKMNLKVFFCFFMCIFIHDSQCWDSEQLEVFDVVEEVKQNFYELLNISKDATDKQIRSAFKSLSLKLHPDKNPDRDTSEEFRNLVSVYEVLRSTSKRQYYEEVLQNGLPNWRSAMYYYRHVRRMGLAEIFFILILIISIGQYLVGWASYAEQKYTLDQKKKKRKKTDKGEDMMIEVPKPSLLNTLPVQIPRLIWWTILEIPGIIVQLKDILLRVTENAEPALQIDEPVRNIKPPKKKKPAFIYPEFTASEAAPQNYNNANTAVSEVPPISGGLWTDDDLDELVQLVRKYPGGTPDRWEVIAECLNRSVAEVTFMANKMKKVNLRTVADEVHEELPKVKQKTKGAKVEDNERELKKWTQMQQKALEDALIKFPKGCTDRWDRIADCVPNKTKEECIYRFRHIAETVKKQKENRESPTEEIVKSDP